MYGWTCPDCGANLDPGEKCLCKEENDFFNKERWLEENADKSE